MKKVLKGIALALLVLMLYSCTGSLFSLLPIKHAVGRNGIKEAISSLEIERLVDENPQFQEVINDMLQPIYEETQNFGIDDAIVDEVVVKIMDTKEVKELVGDITSNLVDFVLTGEEQKLINTDNIESLVGTVIDDINEQGLFEISMEDKNQILQVVREQVNENEDFLPDTSLIEDAFDSETEQVLNNVRFALGNELVLYLVIGILLSIVGIALLKWKEAKWIKWSAITILVATSVTFFLTFVIGMIGGIVLQSDLPYVYDLLAPSIQYSYVLSGSVLLLMIITLIVYHFVHKKQLSISSTPVENA